MIPEQRLREIAAADPVAVNYDTVREIAAELLAARAELAAMRADRDAALLILPACCGSLADAADTLRQERDRYHDALVARHGGEPVALLSELDAAREEIEDLRVSNSNLIAEALKRDTLLSELDAARAENERLEKQRDELLAAAQKCWRFIRDDFCSASCECYRCYLGRAIKTAEQPKPAGGGA